MEKYYEKIQEIGNGTHGTVHKARKCGTNDIVAVKTIQSIGKNKGVPRTAIREASILLEMEHDNIVRLLDVVLSKEEFYLVFEYLPMDLKKHMDLHPDFFQNRDGVKTLLYQMLCGIAYCHSHRVLHRDLKPQNVLVDPENNVLKLADFGLARAFDIPVRTFTDGMVTLWYRAPEILLNTNMYSTPVDVWSAGCIFAEMVNLKPLFVGKTDAEELFKIFSVMGTPNEDTWPGVTSLPDFKPFLHRLSPPKDLATVVPNLDVHGLDLLAKMLCYDPNKRITARSALEHKYFKDMRHVP